MIEDNIDRIRREEQERESTPGSTLLDEYNPEDWLKPHEVAEFFRVDPRTVGRWRRDGKMQSIRQYRTPGNHSRFYRPDIEKIANDDPNQN